MNTILDLLGKFHPLLLHLPIGVIVYAYLHLGYEAFITKKRKKTNLSFALGLGALTAVMSAASGYFLANNGGYEGELLEWHKWLGIGTAVGAILLYSLYNYIKSDNLFFILFTAFMGLLGLTGHYGGSLTHGEDFLSLSPEKEEVKKVEDINKAHVFNDLVMPIANNKCVTCHNPKKKKGELLLNTKEGWIEGGEIGMPIVFGEVENSLFAKRIHLPKSEKEHMPPKGKKQLSHDEIEFISWWTKEASNYEHKLEELSPPKSVVKFVNERLNPSIAPKLDEEEVVKLRASGVRVQKKSKDQDWLSVSFANTRSISKRDLKKLMSVKDNVQELNLSNTGFTDKLMSMVGQFENLTSLDVSQNSITSKGVGRLDNLKALEVLNLYKTDVDKEVLSWLTELPKLKELYLWQSAVTTEDVTSAIIPDGLGIIMGQDLSIFGEVELLPPTIEGKVDIFKDSLSVSITHIVPNARIHYTKDGSEPSINSELYVTPVLVDQAVELKSIAIMDGWEPSGITSRTFFKTGHLIETCKVAPDPNEKYLAEGPSTLTDLTKGSVQFADGKWLGFQGEDVEVTLGLESVREVSTISFGSLQDYRSYIFTPLGAKISISSDGSKFTEIANKKYEQISGPADNLIQNNIISFPESSARFVRLEIEAQKKNPSWHSDPGAKCWLFLDEVVLE